MISLAIALVLLVFGAVLFVARKSGKITSQPLVDLASVAQVVSTVALIAALLVQAWTWVTGTAQESSTPNAPHEQKGSITQTNENGTNIGNVNGPVVINPPPEAPKPTEDNSVRPRIEFLDIAGLRSISFRWNPKPYLPTQTHGYVLMDTCFDENRYYWLRIDELNPLKERALEKPVRERNDPDLLCNTDQRVATDLAPSDCVQIFIGGHSDPNISQINAKKFLVCRRNDGSDINVVDEGNTSIVRSVEKPKVVDPQPTATSFSITPVAEPTIEQTTEPTQDAVSLSDCVIKVTITLVPLYAEPSLFSRQLIRLAPGSYKPLDHRVVRSGSRDEGWFQIRFGKRSGWIQDDTWAIAAKTDSCP